MAASADEKRDGLWLEDLPPDPVIEAYKKDVDRTLFRANLRLTVEQRIQKLEAFMRALESIRGSTCRGRG